MEETTCPYCKEEIKAGAIKCKHCSSALAQDQPDHGGTCPLCKEKIKVDAIKCKHCKSILEPMHAGKGGCGCGCDGAQVGARRLAFRADDDDPIIIGPDNDYRGCENDCTLQLIDCLTTPVNRRSRRYCLNQLRWCSLACRGTHGQGDLFGF